MWTTARNKDAPDEVLQSLALNWISAISTKEEQVKKEAICNSDSNGSSVTAAFYCCHFKSGGTYITQLPPNSKVNLVNQSRVANSIIAHIIFISLILESSYILYTLLFCFINRNLHISKRISPSQYPMSSLNGYTQWINPSFLFV